MKWLRKAFSLNFYIKKLQELKGSPEETAKGLALGVFIGFLPINGFQVLIAVILATLTRVNKLAAAIGTHVTNPWTTIPVLIIDYYLGCYILGKKPCFPDIDLTSFHSIVSCGKEIIAPMFIGGVVLGLIFSILSYFGIKKFLEKEVSAIKSYAKKLTE
ncbi:MAG: DUF2062 domain-containing protein [Desulfurobacteriaceae bacterium]